MDIPPVLRIEILYGPNTAWHFDVKIHDADNMSAAKRSLDRYLLKQLNRIREEQPLLKELELAKKENKRLRQNSVNLNQEIEKEHREHLKIIAQIIAEEDKLKRYQALTEQSKVIYQNEKRKFDKLLNSFPVWLIKFIETFYQKTE